MVVKNNSFFIQFYAEESLGSATVLYLSEEGSGFGKAFCGEWMREGCTRESGALYGGAYRDACLADDGGTI